MSRSEERRIAALKQGYKQLSMPICPRCGHFIPNDETPGKYCGAVSRKDNKTEVCSACGLLEAFEDEHIAPPYTGKPYWLEVTE